MIEPEQNLFVSESAKPQGKHELQIVAKSILNPRLGSFGFDACVEYGITSRLWFGPKVNYGSGFISVVLMSFLKEFDI